MTKAEQGRLTAWRLRMLRAADDEGNVSLSTTAFNLWVIVGFDPILSSGHCTHVSGGEFMRSPHELTKNIACGPRSGAYYSVFQQE